MDNKIKALATFLGIDEKDISYEYNTFAIDGNEYLVLTDGEADAEAKQYILETLWAFNAEFILDTCGLDSSPDVIESLRKMQEDACEGCDDFIRALVDGTCGIDEFVNQAILSDGRGHFLGTYDGKEGEQDGYFIYCIG